MTTDASTTDHGELHLTEPPPGRGVYCNRTLNLRAIKVIGYDMDYTLVHYRVEDWERRAYEHLKARLLADGWPVSELRFDSQLVVRGLVIDSELGNLIKANRFGYVKSAAHGTRRLHYDELRKAYMRTIVELKDPRYTFLNTLFSLSEGCMYAQLVDMLDAGALGDAIGYRDLSNGVRGHIDATHMEGQLKAEIMADPERFVAIDQETVLTLLDQRYAGKRLVLVTNSEWGYADAMMRYSFDRYLPKGMTWRELFDVTVVAARKPSFFESDAPLLEVVNDEGLLRPHLGPLTTHGCYFGGNAAVLERHLGIVGDEMLYLGDHMYGDVTVTKAVLRWRTGLILRELEDEIRAEEQGAALQRELAELMHRKEALEYQLCQLRLRQQRKKGGYAPVPPDGERRQQRLRAELARLDERIAPLAARAEKAHNPYWGLLLRAGNDKSQLARQIERSADIYTSRVSNLMYATPFAYLRSRRGSLPHDPITAPPGYLPTDHRM
jgi:HAD superfamily 5'-nucleotidase-like hydrolase